MKRRVRRINIFCVALLAVVLLVTIYSVRESSLLIEKHNIEIAELKNKLVKESQRKDKLLKDKKFFKSDTYLESIARDTLGLVKPNEIILKPNE